MSSRRALLAGALGGLGAWAASAVGRRSTVRAEGEAIVVGGEYLTATSVTRIENVANNMPVIQGQSLSGAGIYGLSDSGPGVRAISTSGPGMWATTQSSSAVFAQSTSGIGVYGSAQSNWGVYGATGSTTKAATVGQGIGNAAGVEGFSGPGTIKVPTLQTGVYGYAVQDAAARGVVGESKSGHGVHGIATSGFAGYFVGKVYTTKFHEMKEISAPSAPAANHGRLFMRDNGSGKSQLCVRFSSGAVQVIATQP